MAIERRGISLFFLLAALVVVSILAFSTHQMALHSQRKTRRLVDAQAATLLVRSAIACASARLQEGLADPTSDLNRRLRDPALATGAILPIDGDPLLRVTEGYRDAAVTVEIRIERVAPMDPRRLGPTSGGFDAAERRLWLRLTARATVGPAETSLTEIREMPVVHLMPGILGKFSLFVRQAGSDPGAYNRYANSINGWPDDAVLDTDRSIPLVLKNGGELDEGTPDEGDADQWQRRGYVYLGGGRVVLNLTAGNDERYGENFHFFRAGSQPDIPGYFDSSPPPFFTQPPDFSLRHPQTLHVGAPFAPDFAYALKYVVSGFYTVDEQGQSMNLDDRLAVSFPGPRRSTDLRMRSSVLHLFGTRSNPSPTLVLGDVWRRYAEYAGIVVEATGNQVRDAILTYVRQSNAPLAGLPPVPTAVEAAARGDLPADTVVQFAPSPTWATMFGDDATYRAKMCRVVEEPYLRSHDFLVHQEPGIFEPPRSSFAGAGPQATPQTTFSLSLHPSSRQTSPYFAEGDLARLPTDVLRAKAVYRVPDLERFRERFLGPDGRLRLDAAVLITGQDGEITRLPPTVRIDRGGIILLERGHLAISNIEPGEDPDQMLTCVALQGNLLVNTTRGERLAANLVALAGKIVNQNPTRGLDIHGGICVGELPPDSLPRGGRIAYNSLGDPSGPAWSAYYRAFMSDLSLEVTRK